MPVWTYSCWNFDSDLLDGTEDLVEEMVMLMKRMFMQDVGVDMIYAIDGNGGRIR